MDILSLVKKTIRRHSLIAENDSILIGLSGGPDSVALVHLLSRLAQSMKLSLTALYVNHGLRPRAAMKEEKFCAEFCDQLGIDLDIVAEDIESLARMRGGGIEEVARDFRYELFELLRLEDGHDRIALGHHLDDRAETVMFRIIRGTGPSGLMGIPFKRGAIIRPLHDLTKAQILEYLRDQKLGFCHDRSNESLRMSRNWIRQRLLPDIRRRLNPQVDQALISLSELAHEDDAYLENLASEAVSKVISHTPGGKFELVLSTLSAYDGAVRKRLLRYCLKELSSDNQAPDRDVIVRLDELVALKRGKISLPGRVLAEIAQGRLYLYRRKKIRFRNQLTPGRSTRIDSPSITIGAKCRDGSIDDVIFKARSRKVALDADKICFPLVIRNIEAGDRFRPLGMSGRKKVGDYLSDSKVPALLRDEVGVVCDAEGIIWVIGFQIDDRVKVSQKTRKVMLLEFRRRKKSKSQAIRDYS